jgi:hypothetical protein
MKCFYIPVFYDLFVGQYTDWLHDTVLKINMRIHVIVCKSVYLASY